jgi:hypothetical protein
VFCGQFAYLVWTLDGMYVTAENAGAAALVANRATVGGWEQFALVTG